MLDTNLHQFSFLALSLPRAGVHLGGQQVLLQGRVLSRRLLQAQPVEQHAVRSHRTSCQKVMNLICLSALDQILQNVLHLRTNLQLHPKS